MTFVLDLEPETARRLESTAAQRGRTPEELISEWVVSKLGDQTAETVPDFQSAAEYVLKKNEELLRRLA